MVLVVRDHGPGLPADAGEALFERFWRSEGGRSRGRGGAGLGLAIADAIVRAHGGDDRRARRAGAAAPGSLSRSPPRPGHERGRRGSSREPFSGNAQHAHKRLLAAPQIVGLR